MSAPPLVILLVKLQFASLSLYNTCRPDIHHNLMVFSWDKFSKWPWKITQPHSSFFWLLVLWPSTPHQAQSVVYLTVTISHCYSTTSTILPHKLGSEILPKSWMSQGRKKPMRNWSGRVGDIWDDKTGNRQTRLQEWWPLTLMECTTRRELQTLKIILDHYEYVKTENSRQVERRRLTFCFGKCFPLCWWPWLG